MKITIITSCTGQKKYHPEDQLQRSDFEQLHQPEVFRQLEARLKDYQTPAQDLYTGQQHLRLMEGWRHLDTPDQANLNLWIVSAGYGCIRDDRKIVPYELTFQGMKAKDLQKWSKHLSIPTDFRKIIAEPAELILVLLGEPYLRALALDDDVLQHLPANADVARDAAHLQLFAESYCISLEEEVTLPYFDGDQPKEMRCRLRGRRDTHF